LQPGRTFVVSADWDLTPDKACRAEGTDAMRALLVTITAGALALSSAGQSLPQADASALNGTDLVAELSKSVNAKKAKLGDPVKATLTQDVLSHGKVVIRRGSKLVGHVTEVKTRSKDDQESRLGVVFDKAVLKGGGELDFSAVLRALAAPVRVGSVDKPDQMAPPMIGPMVSQSTTAMPVSNGPSGSGSKSAAASGGSANIANQASNQSIRAAEYASAVSSGLNGSDPGNSLMGGGSRGVFGLPGLKITPAPGGTSVIRSTHQNIKLDSGTQMVIQVISVAR